jgi:hypothetical protein
MLRFLAVLLLALAIGAPASADSRTYISVGTVYGSGPHYRHHDYRPYPRHYYYGPPPVVYYVPAPRVYYPPPPPVVYVPAPAVVMPSAPPQAYCRGFQGDATFDESGRPFYGTACLEPDGRWHIVR